MGKIILRIETNHAGKWALGTDRGLTPVQYRSGTNRGKSAGAQYAQ
jgi:hypothetical protein